jgi:hypothetical protein
VFIGVITCVCMSIYVCTVFLIKRIGRRTTQVSWDDISGLGEMAFLRRLMRSPLLIGGSRWCSPSSLLSSRGESALPAQVLCSSPLSPLVMLLGLNFQPGAGVQEAIRHRFGQPVNSFLALGFKELSLVVSFGQCKFKLSDSSVGTPSYKLL